MDDLLDLDWSSAPSSSATELRAPQPPPLKPNHNNSFNFLANTNGNAPSYSSSVLLRSASPSIATKPSQLARSNNSTRAPTPSNAISPTPPSGMDAFSGLLSLPSQLTSQAKSLSLVERQAKMALDKKEKEDRERQQFEAHGSFWDNLGNGGSTSVPNGKASASNPHLDGLLEPLPAPRPTSTMPTVLAPTPAAATAKPKATSSTSAPWDYEDLLSPSASNAKSSTSQTQTPAPADPFDFDSLRAASPMSAPSPVTAGWSKHAALGSTSGMRTPVSDFDFGDREDGDGDLLGDLGKPVRLARKSDRIQPSARPPTQATFPSPPPHVIGQLVEMGFAPQRAREALAKTSTGLDVDAAIEILVGSNGGRQSPGEEELPEDDDDRIQRERERREEEAAEKRRKRRAGPSRESVKPRPERLEAEYTEQADKILAQASEIGQSVLSKATSLWGMGKEKAMKVYEEQRKALEAVEGKKKMPTDGRPRWMVEAEAGSSEDRGRKEGDSNGNTGGFRDLDQASPPRREARAGPSRGPGSSRPTERSTRPGAEDPRKQISVREQADLLFADEPKPYVSSARHRKPTTPAPAPVIPATKSPPAPQPSRKLVQASPSQIQSSSTHKSKGNEHFKLGRYTEAESSYSTAMSTLPTGHLLLIPLHNNRAATRLKLGQSQGSIEDCTTVIELVGPSYHPSREAALPPDMAEIRLGDALVKATTKRAQAWEMAEKWKNAVDDWESVMGFDPILLGSSVASTKSLATDGARRAKKMLEGKDQSEPVVARPPAKVKPTPRAANVSKSAAVSELRKANQVAEAESNEQLQLKDSVDARIVAWKGGKEDNLRALIASLDKVLWEEIMKGGLKVGIHELISEKQVKIKYMKVISRLHPDKLNVGNTTVEQRMLANAAFGALSDAWQDFNK
ncbi:hypothetical protein P7C73_g4017, partial [Tremellales sp. Uapishka_1]